MIAVKMMLGQPSVLGPSQGADSPVRPGRVVTPGEAQGLFYPSLRPNAPEGVLGDPSSALAVRGERYLDAWVDLLEQGYRAAFPTPGAAAKNRA